MPVIEGPAFVVDGDSLVIKKTEIRIYGVDAPELNHPYGKKAKWAMVALCKGQQVRAKIIEKDVHGRAVAMCFLPDGRDLSEEMVKLGLALDWPKYSEGDYRTFEPEGVRKKLWLADARQKGRMYVWAQFDAHQKARAQDQAK
ncbi:MAG: thermonuclease family protein [Tateyamaria sp.]|uniref:thermonuclease family protein n=1 Tax=Tateyamaria sp. TaxID=1929288 RepID=UPI003287D855